MRKVFNIKEFTDTILILIYQGMFSPNFTEKSSNLHTLLIRWKVIWPVWIWWLLPPLEGGSQGRAYFYWILNFITFLLIYSLWGFYWGQRRYDCFSGGHPRKFGVILEGYHCMPESWILIYVQPRLNWLANQFFSCSKQEHDHHWCISTMHEIEGRVQENSNRLNIP